MFDLKILSSLEKVLPKRECAAKEITSLSGLLGEKLSFQAAYATDGCGAYRYEIVSDGDTEFNIYFIENVPVEYPNPPHAGTDTNYISHEAGLYPDRLVGADRDWFQANDIYSSLWITANARTAGEHAVTVRVKTLANETVAEKSLILNIVATELPSQELIYTQWFHTDCISEYYGYEPYSEPHWEMIEKFMLLARENGINMILTPVISPPLDTEIGGKRPTSQLLKIKKDGNSYSFDFTRVERWLDICERVGFEYYEMPHLFTQWGARFTPRIIAEIDGEEKDIFGWEIRSDSDEYDNFLSCLLPLLTDFLKRRGLLEKTYFHISDEPSVKDLEDYGKARKIAEKYLVGCKIIDALSDFDFYRKGVVKIPIPSTDHIKPFLEAQPEEKWSYYCSVQCVDVSNRLIAMPSARNRSIGIQLYKYKMNGFLHWGYNFYYSQLSRIPINPFARTDAYGAFPSGDSISVYPSADGPSPAIGLLVFNEALQDMRALKLLEKSIGHDETVKLIEDSIGNSISFDICYSAEQLLKMRNAVNERIAAGKLGVLQI